MENRRLKEIKLSLYINYIDKAKNRETYSNLMKILTCVAATLGKEYLESFTNLVRQSIGDGLLEASSKEIVLTCENYLNKKKTAKLLGIANSTLYYKFGDLLDRDIDISNIKEPLLNEENDNMMIDFMINFIDNFKFKLGKKEHELKDKERTYELEFWLIYDKLINIFRNVGMCDKFIFNICNNCDIDYSAISQLKNNIHIINRSYPNFRYNNRYFMQEIVTLYTYKGLTKSSIGSSILGRDASYLYNGTNKNFKEIPKDELAWQYTPTIDWGTINKDAVLQFIQLFHSFIEYDI